MLLTEIAVAAAHATVACARVEGLRSIVANPKKYQLNPTMSSDAPPMPLTIHNKGAPIGVQRPIILGGYTVAEIRGGTRDAEK